MAIVIIHGDMRTGKTRRGNLFLRHYKCKRIVDGWDGISKLNDGDLGLTNQEPPFNIAGAKVVDIATAKHEITKAGMSV